jgi:UDP-3-O-[3-hydroxymyristoyl] glucosamine N-acyltransferase
MPAYTLGELQARLGGEVRGDPDTLLDAVASLESAGPSHLGFIVGRKFVEQARASACGALILPPALADQLDNPRLVATNPLAAFARATALLHAEPAHDAGIHPLAAVHPGAILGREVRIGPGAVIEAGARIGERSVIGAQAFVGRDAQIGADALLHPHAIVMHACVVGDRCILHPGCVIGADGFGNAWDDGRWVKIPQIGRTVLGDDVEIGANTTIDRGALDDTVIEDGARLDNLIQVAHNCRIGRNTAIAACTGIAGSTRIGAHCLIGGAAMIIGHLDICDGVTISAGTFVAKDIRQPGVYTSTQPLMAHEDWKRNAAHLRHLDALAQRIKELEKLLKKD